MLMLVGSRALSCLHAYNTVRIRSYLRVQPSCPNASDVGRCQPTSANPLRPVRAVQGQRWWSQPPKAPS
jgi:hypothetical protein